MMTGMGSYTAWPRSFCLIAINMAFGILGRFLVGTVCVVHADYLNAMIFL